MREPLPKAGTVAQLLAHAEKLTRRDVFKGKPDAKAIYYYCCMHPAREMRHNQAHAVHEMLVDGHASARSEIIAGSGVPQSTLYKWLTWLRDERLIRGGPGSGTREPLTVLLGITRSDSMRWNYDLGDDDDSEEIPHGGIPDTDPDTHAIGSITGKNLPHRRKRRVVKPGESLIQKAFQKHLAEPGSIEPARVRNKGLDVDEAMAELYPDE
jgi:hypothetical protein